MKAIHAIATTDAEIDAAIASAKEVENDPRAKEAKYDPRTDLVFVKLTDGTRLVLQRENLQGLQNATKAQLSDIEILGIGNAINWPKLDVGFYLPSLLQGFYGSKQWMKSIASLGGRAKSEAKSKAARENGARGGRPKKSPVLARTH